LEEGSAWSQCERWVPLAIGEALPAELVSGSAVLMIDATQNQDHSADPLLPESGYSADFGAPVAASGGIGPQTPTIASDEFQAWGSAGTGRSARASHHASRDAAKRQSHLESIGQLRLLL